MARKLAGLGFAFAVAELAAALLPPLAVLPAAALLVLAAIGLVRRRRSRYWPLLAGALLGLVWSLAFRCLVVAPVCSMAGQTVHATARVETDAVAGYETGMQRGTLCLTDIEGHAGPVRVQCWRFPAMAAGERFTATFALQALEDNAYRMGNYADGVYLEAEFLGDYSPLPASRGLRFALYRLRQTLSARLRTYLPRLYAGLEIAMLLGDRTLLSKSTTRAFQLAGVAHLLAVSGLHVSLLCGLFVMGGGRAARFSRPHILLRALLILFYMALTGFPVSVLRAGIALLIALLGDFLLQPPDYLTSMGAAALLLGLQNAYAPCDIGFQLSFCAVLGVELAGVLAEWEHRRLPYGDAAPGTLPALVWRLLQVIQAAAIASLATLPVLLAHDMTTSSVAVVGNLLVVWMLRPALLLGILVLLLSLLPVLAPCMHMASLLLAVWLRVLLALVEWCASLPMARLVLPRRYTLWVLAVLGVLALVFWLGHRLRWYPPAALLCLVLAAALGVLWQRDVVTVTLVGSAGNPCAVITQNGTATVLFRGGAANLEAVEDHLVTHGAPEQTRLIDLRQQPQPLEFAAAEVVTMAQIPGDRAITLGPGCVLTLFSRSSGNLAVLETGGSRVAMAAGSIRLETPVEVDVFCGGGTLPASVSAGRILVNTGSPRWLDAAGQTPVLYGSGEPSVIIRPGRSVTIEEAKAIAVQ